MVKMLAKLQPVQQEQALVTCFKEDWLQGVLGKLASNCCKPGAAA
jgi:hypothetical protein